MPYNVKIVPYKISPILIVFILLVCGIGVMIGLFSCSLPDLTEKETTYKPNVEIVEHYAGCVNPAHTEFHEDAARGMRLMWEDEGKVFHINPNHTLLPKPKKEAGK